MRKSVRLLFVAWLVFGMARVASATLFDTGIVTLNHDILSHGSYDFSIATNGFSVPPDIVTSAALDITATGVIGTADPVYVDTPIDLFIGNLNSQSGSNHFSDTNLPIPLSVFSSWTDPGTLAVDVVAGNQAFTLDTYRFTANYTDPPPSSVPEPSTLLLLGAGLVGVGLLRRSFKK
jgi:hypothetical protein